MKIPFLMLRLLLDEGVVKNLSFDDMLPIVCALDEANVRYAKTYFAGASPHTPAVYTVRLLTEDPSNEERLRALLRTADVSVREPDRGVSPEAAALEAIRTRSRAEARTDAAPAEVQPPSLGLVAALVVGAIIGCAVALLLAAFGFAPHVNRWLLIAVIVVSGAGGGLLGEVIGTKLRSRRNAPLQTGRQGSDSAFH